ncbi:MAG: hypothetical protein ACM3XR_03725, partial [Bacillota bacterium]
MKIDKSLLTKQSLRVTIIKPLKNAHIKQGMRVAEEAKLELGFKLKRSERLKWTLKSEQRDNGPLMRDQRGAKGLVNARVTRITYTKS